MGKFEETESRTHQGLGHREVVFNGYRVHVWGDEKVLEMDSGDG